MVSRAVCVLRHSTVPDKSYLCGGQDLNPRPSCVSRTWRDHANHPATTSSLGFYFSLFIITVVSIRTFFLYHYGSCRRWSNFSIVLIVDWNYDTVISVTISYALRWWWHSWFRDKISNKLLIKLLLRFP